MYLNTTSGLTPMLDAIGTAVTDNAKFNNRQQGYVDAGILPASSAPQGGVLSSLFPGLFGQQKSPEAAASPTASSPSSTTASSDSDRLPTFAAAPPSVSSNEIARYVGQGSLQRGVDPSYSLRVVGAEGGFSPNRVGDGGSSFGPFQLHYGGVASGGNAVAGLGDDFTKATGLDARDPANWKAATDFALDHIAKNGWGAFHGAAKAGIGNWDGISRGGTAMAYAPTQGGAGATPAGAATAAIGQRANEAAGAASMPIATSSPSAQPTPQGGAAQAGGPRFANAPAAMSGITVPQIQALIRNKDTEQIGLKLWGSAATGKNFGFQVTPTGDVLRTNDRTGQAEMILRAPVKREHVELNGRALSFDPQAGAYTDATPAGLPQGYRPATAQERDAYHAQSDAPLFIGPDGRPGTLNSGVNVVNNMSTNPILEGLGKQFVSQRGEADSAAKSLPIIADARTLLKSGIFAGTGAPQVLALQKLGVALGLPGADASRITTTEQFSAATKPLVLQLVKNLGSGSGITDADVRFINEAVGADKTLEPASMLGILDRLERSARSKISDYNTLADQMMKTPGGEAFRHIGPMMHVQMPPAAASATKTIGGTTYTQRDGHWYTSQ